MTNFNQTCLNEMKPTLENLIGNIFHYAIGDLPRKTFVSRVYDLEKLKFVGVFCKTQLLMYELHVLFADFLMFPIHC